MRWRSSGGGGEVEEQRGTERARAPKHGPQKGCVYSVARGQKQRFEFLRFKGNPQGTSGSQDSALFCFGALVLSVVHNSLCCCQSFSRACS